LGGEERSGFKEQVEGQGRGDEFEGLDATVNAIGLFPKRRPGVGTHSWKGHAQRGHAIQRSSYSQLALLRGRAAAFCLSDVGAQWLRYDHLSGRRQPIINHEQPASHAHPSLLYIDFMNEEGKGTFLKEYTLRQTISLGDEERGALSWLE